MSNPKLSEIRGYLVPMQNAAAERGLDLPSPHVFAPFIAQLAAQGTRDRPALNVRIRQAAGTYASAIRTRPVRRPRADVTI